MSDETYGPKIYRMQEGDVLVIANGGELKVETGGVISANGTQAATIDDITVTGTYADDDSAIETAINSIIAALKGAGIIASS